MKKALFITLIAIVGLTSCQNPPQVNSEQQARKAVAHFILTYQHPIYTNQAFNGLGDYKYTLIDATGKNIEFIGPCSFILPDTIN